MKNLAVLLFSLVILQGCLSDPLMTIGSVANAISGGSRDQVKTGSDQGKTVKDIVADPNNPSKQGRLLNFSVSYKYRGNGGDAAPQELTERSVLHSGDTYKIQFTPDEDCYVYIFQYDSSLKLVKLFPFDSNSKLFESLSKKELAVGNPVRGGQTYTLPADHKSYRLDTQRGTETIHFLAYREPNETLESEYQAVFQAQQTGNEPKAKAVRGKLVKEFGNKSLAGIVKDGGKVSEKPDAGEFFATKIATVSDSPDSGSRTDELEMCEDCISSITFRHQ